MVTHMIAMKSAALGFVLASTGLASTGLASTGLAASSAAAASHQTSTPAAVASADAIIDRYIAAIGGQKNLDAIQSMIIRGTYTENGQSGSGVLARMRPFYKLVGDPLKRSTEFEEGYDGSAWEFYGDPGIVLRTAGPASAAARHGLYILGNLVDYKRQGSSVTLKGVAKIDGRDAYQLRVRMLDGFEQDEFIDAKSWLVVADRKVAKVHAFGVDVPSETRWSDYRTVNGVLLAFLNVEVEIASGKELNRFQTDRIDVNLILSPSQFMPPRLERTPVQVLMDQIFQEREDADAVRWTYHDFRNAYSDTDTEAAMEIIGYQMLKMGDPSAATALLEDNRRDYPDSAAAHFGLARAYRSAGRLGEARAEFERTLALEPKHQRAQTALAEMAPAR
jgi:tetratricopeptide (TPR) repeat protein